MTMLIFIWGLMLGSFLNVCIYRIPKSESVVLGHSHCTSCTHALSVLDLCPVLSYLCLKGKCRYCKETISSRYMLVELLIGILFVILYKDYGLSYEMFLYEGFIAILIVLSMIDLELMILPTSIIVSGLGTGLIAKGIQSYLSQDYFILVNTIIGGVVGFGLFYLLAVISEKVMKKEALGFGDVRLMGMLGVYVGVEQLFIMLLIASLSACIVGCILLIKNKRSEAYPLGPFLCSGTVVMILWGQPILRAYEGFLGL